MDHHEKHHEQHRKEREQEKHQHHLHAGQKDKANDLKSPYPMWFLVIGAILLAGVVLVWTMY